MDIKKGTKAAEIMKKIGAIPKYPMEFRCGTCGNKTDTCYTDEGVLGMVHGSCQCRECYSKTHPLCLMCNELTDELWTYCAHCGAFINKRVCPTGKP